MRKAYAWLIVALIALASAAPAAAKREWLRADTHHFIIYNSNDKVERLEEFATNIERFDALLRQYLNLPEEDHPNRLTIFLLPYPEDVAEVEGRKDSAVAGFYKPLREGSIAISNSDRRRHRGQSQGQITLFHEYTHHLMAHYFAYSYSAWYQEGVADYLSTVSFDKHGAWTVGRPVFGYAYGLTYVEMPIKYVLFGRANMMDIAAANAYYSRAWLLVHMAANDLKRADQLGRYLKEIGDGIEPEKAVADTFGDLDQLEEDLEDYQEGRLTYSTSTTPVPYAEAMKITPLDEIDSRLAELEMRRRAGTDPEGTRNALRQLALDAPGRAPVLLQLALAERDLANTTEQPDFALAETAVDSSLLLDSTNVRANVLKAELMMDRLSNSNSDEAQWNEARSYISRANHLDPEDPLPLLVFAESYDAEGKARPAVAFDAVEKAFSLEPEAADVRITYAYALANEGKFDQALKLVGFLASDPHGDTYGKEVVAEIEAMRDGASPSVETALPQLVGVAGEGAKP